MKKCSVVLALLVAMLPVSVFAADAAPTWEEPRPVNSQTLAPSDVKSLSVALMGESFSIVELEAEDGQKDEYITVEVISNFYDKNPTVTLDKKGMLKIEQKDKKAASLKKRTCSVIITVPKKFSVSDLTLQVAGGTTSLLPLSAKTMAIKVDGGSLIADELTAEKSFSVSVSDGSFEASKIEGNDMTLECKKGSLKSDKAVAKVFTLNADKGSINVEFIKDFEKESSVTVGTGDITLGLPSNLAFFCSATVDNGGTVKSEFALDSKGPTLKAKVGKGSLAIEKR